MRNSEIIKVEDMPRWVMRSFLLAVAPIVVVWTIISRTWTEVRSIPFFIRCDLSGEFTEFRRIWRAAGSNRA